MTTQLLILIASFGMVLAGGEALVRGASDLARRLGVSPTVIGLTVVGFGTSAPELAVSLTAAHGGSSAIAFGNVVGSNIGNIALILGLAALLRPLTVESSLLSREIPMMILCALAVASCSIDGWLGDAETDVISRSDGIGLLLLFCVFLYYTAAGNLLGRRADPLVAVAETSAPAASSWRAGPWVLVLIGLAGLILGGRFLVSSATSLARTIGIAEAVIGSTIVAVGTSLPELVTSLLATRRGATDLAVANVVGSNIFNATFILGTTAVLRPVAVPAGGAIELGALLVASFALLVMAFTGGRRISRFEGGLLFVGYGAYLAWQLNR